MSPAPRGEEKPFSVPLADYLAREMDHEGRVASIVWSLSDPLFRHAYNTGLVQGRAENPEREDVLRFGRDRKIEYIFFIRAQWVERGIDSELEVFRSGRSVWRDRQIVGASTARGFDLENTARSLANTWRVLLCDGPLKGLEARPIQRTPPPTEGQAPKVPVVRPLDMPADNTQLFAEWATLIQERDYDGAVRLLRGGIDEEPFDASRRKKLVETLLLMREPQLAALAARNALQVAPWERDFWVYSAQAWLSAEDRKLALQHLDEAIARYPERAELRVLIALLHLTQLDAAAAERHLSEVQSGEVVAEVALGRSLTAALRGDVEDAESAWRLAQETGLEYAGFSGELRYELLATCFYRAVERMLEETLRLLNRASRSSERVAVQAELSGILRRGRALAHLAGAYPPPTSHHLSHERRLLALKLLVQSWNDLEASLQAPATDASLLTNARILYGEALREASTAQKQFEIEQDDDERTVANEPIFSCFIFSRLGGLLGTYAPAGRSIYATRDWGGFDAAWQRGSLSRQAPEFSARWLGD